MLKLNELDSISHAQAIEGYSKLSELSLLYWRPLIMFMDSLSQRRSGDAWAPPARHPPHMPRGWSCVERVERSIVPHLAHCCAETTRLSLWDSAAVVLVEQIMRTWRECFSIVFYYLSLKKRKATADAGGVRLWNLECPNRHSPEQAPVRIRQENASENLIERDVLHRNRATR